LAGKLHPNSIAATSPCDSAVCSSSQGKAVAVSAQAPLSPPPPSSRFLVDGPVIFFRIKEQFFLPPHSNQNEKTRENLRIGGFYYVSEERHIHAVCWAKAYFLVTLLSQACFWRESGMIEGFYYDPLDKYPAHYVKQKQVLELHPVTVQHGWSFGEFGFR
jgi:hypothetical protein